MAHSPSFRQLRPDSSASHRAAEITLAGLRPGRDTLEKIQRLFRNSSPATSDDGTQTWQDPCATEAVSVNADSDGTILAIHLARTRPASRDCASRHPRVWLTGHGIGIGSSCSRVISLYGNPDSTSPSTGSHQKLELLYYAFDWAGPDVPQVMEVFCTIGGDGKPRTVAEITLAAPSL